MKRSALLLLLFLSFFVSCNQPDSFTLIRSEEISIISWKEGSNLVVVLLDEEVSGSPVEVTHSLLQEVQRTLTTLVQVLNPASQELITEQQLLTSLVEGASSLRKTRLADTLSAISGQSDTLAKMEKIQGAYLFDLRGKLDAVSDLEDYLMRFIEQTKRSIRRRR